MNLKQEDIPFLKGKIVKIIKNPLYIGGFKICLSVEEMSKFYVIEEISYPYRRVFDKKNKSIDFNVRLSGFESYQFIHFTDVELVSELRNQRIDILFS